MLQSIAIWIIHKLTKDSVEQITWELGYAEVNDIDFISASKTEYEHAEEVYETGFSLLNFMAGYLNAHARLQAGWVPPEHQIGYWEDFGANFPLPEWRQEQLYAKARHAERHYDEFVH